MDSFLLQIKIMNKSSICRFRLRDYAARNYAAPYYAAPYYAALR
jgi:hypothetical protein